MSNAAMSAVFRHSQSKGAARLVLLTLADEANDEGLLTAYRRSQAHLAAKANMDVRSLRRALAALVDLGELEVLQRGNGRASTDYRLTVPTLVEGGHIAHPQPPAEGGHIAHPGGTHSAPRGGVLRTPSSPSTPVPPRSSARAAAGAAGGQLPLDADPQPVDAAGDSPDPMAIAWQLVRSAYDWRPRKPLEGRPATAKVVRRLLDAGWTPHQVESALRSSPAWTPTSLQVELARGGARPGRAPANRVPVDDDRRQGPSRVVDVAQEMRRRGR